jgi:hypothetical protein
LEPDLAEKIAICAHTTYAEELEGLDGILYEAAQNIVVFGVKIKIC